MQACTPHHHILFEGLAILYINIIELYTIIEKGNIFSTFYQYTLRIIFIVDFTTLYKYVEAHTGT